MKYQKGIGLSLSIAIVSSQISCAGKVTTIPLNQAQFSKKYSYTIKTTQNAELPALTGDQIHNKPDRLLITQNNETKYLLHSHIADIRGESLLATRKFSPLGLILGGAIGGVGGFFAGGAIGDPIVDRECEGEEGPCGLNLLPYFIFGSLIGIVAGGGIGTLIGLSNPKKSKIQIVPTISPAQGAVNSGVRMETNF